MSNTICNIESGTCGKCQSACERKPGWFKPGEVEAVAEYLGLTLPELFASKLAVDWWVGGGKDYSDIYTLSPALIGEHAGIEFPGDPRGQCVFFKDGRCEIHPVKPFECAESLPCDDSDGRNLHKEAADAWNTEENQGQIRVLLGRQPESAEFEGGGMFGGLFGF